MLHKHKFSGIRWFVIMAFFVQTAAYGQGGIRDSLRNVILNSPTIDTTFILTLCDYAYAFDDISYDSIKNYAERALRLSQDLDYDRGMAYSLWLIGMSNYYLDKIDSSHLLLEQALPYAVKSGDVKSMARIYNSMANVSRYLGNRAKAVELYFESLRRREASGDLDGASITLNNIATVYTELGERERALPYYRQSLDIRRKLNKESTSLIILSGLAENHLELGNIDSAYYYLRRGLRFAASVTDPWNAIYVYPGLIEYHLALDQPDSAMYYALNAAQAARKAGSLDREAGFLLTQGRIFNLRRQYHQALDVLEIAIPIAQKVKRTDYAIEANKIKSEAMAGLGRFQEAYESYVRYKALSDSAQSKAFGEALRAHGLQYELDKQRLQAENERQSFNESRARTRLLLLMTGAISILVGITAFVLYRSVRSRTRSNQQLQEKQQIIEDQNNAILSQNEELRSQQEQISTANRELEEKVQIRTRELHETINHLTQRNAGLEQFSFIVSHNLRAPLARITGLVNLLGKPNVERSEVEQYHRHLGIAAKEFDSVITDLSQIVSFRKSLDLVRESIDIRQLVESVLRMLEPELKVVHSKIDIAFNGVTHVIAVRIFLHSILLNLISNAIKYRSPDRTLELRISGYQEDGRCYFSVEDNGIGIPLNEHTTPKIFGLYNRFHPSIEGRGFGLYLVRTQLELMGGEIDVKSEVKKGSVFTFYIPQHERKS